MVKSKQNKKIRHGKKSMKGSKDKKETGSGKRFVLREFMDKGEKHFIIVKKESPNSSAVNEAEEIFADWKKNFAQIKRPRSLKPRVRKLSHRRERKELIKEAEQKEKNVMGPLTYSQMLKRNLKANLDQPSVEEIFESWTALTKQIEECNIISTKITLQKQLEDVDYFKVWKHNFHVESYRPEDVDILYTTTCIPSLANFECGQPTIPTDLRMLTFFTPPPVF